MGGASEAKSRGNEFLKAGKLEEALAEYTKCVELEPGEAVYWSNRSAALANLRRWDEALSDAQRATELRPDWSKAHQRLGFALQGLDRLDDACAAYVRAVELDGADGAAQAALDKVRVRMASEIEARIRPDVEFAAEHKVKGEQALKSAQFGEAEKNYDQTLKGMEAMVAKLPPEQAAALRTQIETVRSNMQQELEFAKLAEQTGNQLARNAS